MIDKIIDSASSFYRLSFPDTMRDMDFIGTAVDDQNVSKWVLQPYPFWGLDPVEHIPAKSA